MASMEGCARWVESGQARDNDLAGKPLADRAEQQKKSVAELALFAILLVLSEVESRGLIYERFSAFSQIREFLGDALVDNLVRLVLDGLLVVGVYLELFGVQGLID